MSMYADYIRERTDDDIVESDAGFATFRFINDGKSVYIIDIYVEPGHRKSGHASDLANEIAEIGRGRGCSELLGTVVPSTRGSTTSIKVLLAYGMTLHSASNDLIVFRKDI